MQNPAAPTHCVHCAAPLDALTRRRNITHCGASACRQRAEADALHSRWQRVAQRAVQQALHTAVETDGVPAAQAEQQRPAPSAVSVLWLQATERELDPVDEGLRQRLAAHWRLAAHKGQRTQYIAADADEVPRAAAALCGQCAGRCCWTGGGNHAYIDADVMDRWLAAHPGADVEAAITDYLARLPTHHVRGACAFQAATGCTLPRTQRAHVCNGYACDALQQLTQAVTQDPNHVAVVLTRQGPQLERAARLQQGQCVPLQGLGGADGLMGGLMD